MDLLEREGPLRRLGELVEQTAQGEGRIALIRGEAGIGKTSVARALTHGIADQAHVLWGSCDDLLAPRPLGPIVDMSFEEGPTTTPFTEATATTFSSALTATTVSTAFSAMTISTAATEPTRSTVAETTTNAPGVRPTSRAR